MHRTRELSLRLVVAGGLREAGAADGGDGRHLRVIGAREALGIIQVAERLGVPAGKECDVAELTLRHGREVRPVSALRERDRTGQHDSTGFVAAPQGVNEGIPELAPRGDLGLEITDGLAAHRCLSKAGEPDIDGTRRHGRHPRIEGCTRRGVRRRPYRARCHRQLHGESTGRRMPELSHEEVSTSSDDRLCLDRLAELDQSSDQEPVGRLLERIAGNDARAATTAPSASPVASRPQTASRRTFACTASRW